MSQLMMSIKEKKENNINIVKDIFLQNSGIKFSVDDISFLFFRQNNISLNRATIKKYLNELIDKRFLDMKSLKVRSSAGTRINDQVAYTKNVYFLKV